MDVAIVPSTLESESFGVSAVEAEACGTPVIISDIPGLMEATKPGVTSVVVPRNNSTAIADAVIKLYDEPAERIAIGEAGRAFAKDFYELNECFKKPESLFEKYAGGGYYLSKLDFKRLLSIKNRTNKAKFVLGDIKGLNKIYGIDLLLKAVAEIRDLRPDIELEVRIAGRGEEEPQLKQLANDLSLDSIVSWLGFISQDQVAYEWANMDIAIIPSRRESFGVSSVEAQACGVPVIISNIPGLMETTYYEEVNVFKLPNYSDLARKIIYLYDNPKKIRELGLLSNKNVKMKYELDHCFRNIESLFNRIASN